MGQMGYSQIYGNIPYVGHDNSMGLVRYYLAFAVLIAHFNEIFGSDFYFPTSSYNAVGGFFALSGFLVYRSYLRSKNLNQYLLRRAKRIFPPYIFIVVSCAVGLVFVSDLYASDYFFNWQWVKYLVCNIGFMNFLEPELPGVFQNQVIHAVNGSLWTMKVEVFLYLSVPIVFWLTVFLHKRFSRTSPFLVFGLIYFFSLTYRLLFLNLYESTEKEIFNIFSRQVFGQLMYFYTGVYIFFKYEKFLKYRLQIAIISLTVLLICSDIPYFNILISPIPVSCLVLVASSMKGLSLFNSNNISYDIYLFHFPVLQIVYSLHIECGIAMKFILSVFIIMSLGFLSWFFIEKHFVKSPLKKI